MDFKFGVVPPRDWFEEIWRIREEEIYPALFGTLPETVIPVSIETLRAIIGQEKEIDPSWLHYAVIEVEPNEKHADWIYVTSALSQPWKAENEAELDQSGTSGLGIEMLLRTPERASWAVDVLHRLGAYQIGVYSELMKGKLFKWHDWMPLNGPISPEHPATPVRGMLITHPRDIADHFELASGQVDLLQIVGITGPELAYGIYKGFDLLENLLYESGAAPTTDPARATIGLPQEYPLPAQLAGRF